MKRLFLFLSIAIFSVATAFAEEEILRWTDGITENASASFSGGNGSQSNPFLISTAEDLAQLAVNVNSKNRYIGIYFRQTADIDLAGKYWIPIADGVSDCDYSFRGHYNGDYHVVSNMKIKASLCNTKIKHFLGLFAWIYRGSLKNLGVVNGEVLVDNYRNDDAALLLGYADTDATVDRCFATGRVETTAANNVAIGGLVGKNYSNGTITNCYFIGELISAGNTKTGGLLPNAQTAVRNCYVAATFENSATYQCALASSYTTNCYYDNTLNPNTMEGQGTGKPTEEIKTAEMAATLGEAFAYDAEKNDGYPYLVGFSYEKTTTTAVENTKISTFYTENGYLHSSEPFRIYDILGKDVTKENGHLRGVYVVKTKDNVQKIVVRNSRNKACFVLRFFVLV